MRVRRSPHEEEDDRAHDTAQLRRRTQVGTLHRAIVDWKSERQHHHSKGLHQARRQRHRPAGVGEVPRLRRRGQRHPRRGSTGRDVSDRLHTIGPFDRHL